MVAIESDDVRSFIKRLIGIHGRFISLDKDPQALRAEMEQFAAFWREKEGALDTVIAKRDAETLIATIDELERLVEPLDAPSLVQAAMKIKTGMKSSDLTSLQRSLELLKTKMSGLFEAFRRYEEWHLADRK